jgi:hypothetical protein
MEKNMMGERREGRRGGKTNTKATKQQKPKGGQKPRNNARRLGVSAAAVHNTAAASIFLPSVFSPFLFPRCFWGARGLFVPLFGPFLGGTQPAAAVPLQNNLRLKTQMAQSKNRGDVLPVMGEGGGGVHAPRSPALLPLPPFPPASSPCTPHKSVIPPKITAAARSPSLPLLPSNQNRANSTHDRSTTQTKQQPHTPPHSLAHSPSLLPSSLPFPTRSTPRAAAPALPGTVITIIIMLTRPNVCVCVCVCLSVSFFARPHACVVCLLSPHTVSLRTHTHAQSHSSPLFYPLFFKKRKSAHRPPSSTSSSVVEPPSLPSSPSSP